MTPSNGWDPSSAEDWAKVLGLVPVPLFGAAGEGAQAHVLLDGQRGSFGLDTDGKQVLRDQQNSWAWSSHLNHYLVLEKGVKRLLVNRWDSGRHEISIPSNQREAEQLLNSLENAPPPRQPDVVAHLLRLFGMVRSVINDPVDSLRLFNALLVVTESVRTGKVEESDALHAHSLREITDLLGADLDAGGVGPFSSEHLDADLGALMEGFVSPEPLSGCVLRPKLLLRHASSYLYQQAHLAIERDPQLSFPGFSSVRHLSASAPRDVRFTPPSLARALVEQALNEMDLEREELHILDPACGSGVFLQEAYRELTLRGVAARVKLVGFDISRVSTVITNFCLSHGLGTAARDPVFEVREVDALSEEWGSPDIVLMNPPFVSWASMSRDQRDATDRVLQGFKGKRPDIAMAFIWRALEAVAPGGVVVSILPAALLETESGAGWREKVNEIARIALLGRFENPAYFAGAIVEPAFVVLVKDHIRPKREVTQIVIARRGGESAALRALRRGDLGDGRAQQYEVFRASSDLVTREDWTPRWRSDYAAFSTLAGANISRVGDLFDVKQGARTGLKSVFVLSSEQVESLPESEQALFRPAADNLSIQDGRLTENVFMFFPFDAKGVQLIEDHIALRESAPTYSRLYLEPNHAALSGRSEVVESNWWLPTRSRAWQRVVKPKLVSSYFGDRGSFSYDSTGRFVVVQGWAWLWLHGSVSGVDFHESLLPWAYLAITNSRVFEGILGMVCPKVAGGQYNLSSRFVVNAFLPDLRDDRRVRGSVVRTLSDLGRQLLLVGVEDLQDELDYWARLVYGVDFVEGR